MKPSSPKSPAGTPLTVTPPSRVLPAAPPGAALPHTTQVAPPAPPLQPPQRRRLLDAGLAVFGRHGFRTTTMSLVAEEAEISRQGLYTYYLGKEALFEACAEDLHAGARHAALVSAQAARAAGHDPAGVLTAQLVGSYAAFFARMQGTPHVAELLDEVARRCRAVVTQHAELTTDALADTLLAEVDAGRLALDPIQAQRLALFLLAAVRGLKAAVPPIPPEALQPDLAAMVCLLLDGATAQSQAARHAVEPSEAPEASDSTGD